MRGGIDDGLTQFGQDLRERVRVFNDYTMDPSMRRMMDGVWDKYEYEYMKNPTILHFNPFTDMMVVDEDLTVNFDKFLTLGEEEAGTIWTAMKELDNKSITKEEYNKRLSGICRNERIVFNNKLEESLNELATSLNGNLADVSIDGKHIFRDMCLASKISLHNHIKVTTTAKWCPPSDFFPVVKAFAERNDCQNSWQFGAMAEFMYQFMCNEKRNRGDKKLLLAKLKVEGPTDEKNQLDAEYNTHLDEMTQAQASEGREFKFEDNVVAAYHVYKHKVFDGENVSAETYLDIAKDLFGNNQPVKDGLTQDGKRKLIYKLPGRQLRGVLIGVKKAGNVDGYFMATMYQDKGN